MRRLDAKKKKTQNIQRMMTKGVLGCLTDGHLKDIRFHSHLKCVNPAGMLTLLAACALVNQSTECIIKQVLIRSMLLEMKCTITGKCRASNSDVSQYSLIQEQCRDSFILLSSLQKSQSSTNLVTLREKVNNSINVGGAVVRPVISRQEGFGLSGQMGIFCVELASSPSTFLWVLKG